MNGFPTQTFLMLVGVTLLFTQAQLNGTLERVAHASVRICRGNTGLVPVMFFVLAAIIATLGPGNVATAAMLAPMAMGVGTRAAIPPFLMAIMVGNGAQSGALSPLAPTGVIVTPLMEKIGLGGHEWQTYAMNLAAHAMVAFAGYALFGGLRLFKNRFQGDPEEQKVDNRFTTVHWVTHRDHRVGAAGGAVPRAPTSAWRPSPRPPYSPRYASPITSRRFDACRGGRF